MKFNIRIKNTSLDVCHEIFTCSVLLAMINDVNCYTTKAESENLV